MFNFFKKHCVEQKQENKIFCTSFDALRIGDQIMYMGTERNDIFSIPIGTKGTIEFIGDDKNYARVMWDRNAKITFTNFGNIPNYNCGYETDICVLFDKIQFIGWDKLNIITLTEFFNTSNYDELKEKEGRDFYTNGHPETKMLAIHCNTKEKSDILRKRFNELGKTWRSGKSYLELDDRDDSPYNENLCYKANGTWGNIDNVIHECTVYEFNNVILDK